jgi:hypothetical protein
VLLNKNRCQEIQYFQGEGRWFVCERSGDSKILCGATDFVVLQVSMKLVEDVWPAQ